MSVIQLSYAKDRDKPIAKNFRAGEFASIRDGKLYSDVILYGTDTVNALVLLRERLDLLGYDCTSTDIHSGYRTPEHDRKVGGTGSGSHTKGHAADFSIRCRSGAYTVLENGSRCVDARLICCLLQDMNVPGIEYIGGRSAHVDAERTNRWWTYQVRSPDGSLSYRAVTDFFAQFQIPREAARPPSAGAPGSGDVNGDGRVDSTDARLVLQAEVGLVELTPAQYAAADMDGDGKVDSTDARLMLQKEVGLL